MADLSSPATAEFFFAPLMSTWYQRYCLILASVTCLDLKECHLSTGIYVVYMKLLRKSKHDMGWKGIASYISNKKDFLLTVRTWAFEQKEYLIHTYVILPDKIQLEERTKCQHKHWYLRCATIYDGIKTISIPFPNCISPLYLKMQLQFLDGLIISNQFFLDRIIIPFFIQL